MSHHFTTEFYNKNLNQEHLFSYQEKHNIPNDYKFIKFARKINIKIENK